MQLMGRATSKQIAKRTLSVGSLRKKLEALKREGLIEGSTSRPRLTSKGRKRIKVVFTGGSFEIIHPGHLYHVAQAKRLGDVLVVVLARGSTIRKRKGREPVSKEQERRELMSSLRQVDAALLGGKGSIYDMMEKVGPDIVALGYDQYHSEKDILKEAKKRGMKLKVVRLKAKDHDAKTSKILAEFI